VCAQVPNFDFCRDLPVLALKYDEFVIGNEMATSALRHLDVAIIDEAPLFVCNHPHVRNNYVFQPTAQGELAISCCWPIYSFP